MCRQIQDVLARGFPWLRFEAPLEDRFIQQAAYRRRQHLLLAGGGAIALFVGMLISDALLMPDVLDWGLWLRLGVFTMLVLPGMALVAWGHLPRLNEWLVTLASLLAAVIIVFLSLLSDSAWALSTLVTLNLVVVYAITVGRFWPALCTALGVLALHVLAVQSMVSLQDPLAVGLTLLLLATMAYTLYGNYTLEHGERQAHLLQMQELDLQAELADANAILEQTARTDALTGVANRRHLDDYLQQTWSFAQRERQSLGLIMIDVDQFKVFNDTQGHPAGDACLISVARAISSCLRRPTDLLARWGGEEFAVVLSGASLEATQHAAERIRQAVEHLAIAHPGSPSGSRVTVSLGVSAVAPGPESRLDDLLHTADACLYEAKARGRNRWWSRPADPLGGLPQLAPQAWAR